MILPETSLLAREVAEKRLGFVCDMRRPKTLTAAIAKLRELALEEVKAMSLHPMRPENALASTPEARADRLLALYDGLLGEARAGRAA